MPTDLDRLFGEDTTNGNADPLDALDSIDAPAAEERERHAPDPEPDPEYDRQRAALLRERAEWYERRAAAARPVGPPAAAEPPAGAAAAAPDAGS